MSKHKNRNKVNNMANSENQEREEETAIQQETLNTPTAEEVVEEEVAATPLADTAASEAQPEVEQAPVQEAKIETVKEEIKVEDTSAAVTPSVNSVRVTTAAAATTVNRRVQTFELLAQQYVAMSKGQICTEAVMKQRLNQFANLIRMIINTTDTAVYDAAYQFFKEHRNDILHEDCVFGYIHAIPTEQSIRMQTIYTTFRELVESNLNKKHFALDYGLIRDNLKLPAQHPLCTWIRKKLGNNN